MVAAAELQANKQSASISRRRFPMSFRSLSERAALQVRASRQTRPTARTDPQAVTQHSAHSSARRAELVEAAEQQRQAPQEPLARAGLTSPTIWQAERERTEATRQATLQPHNVADLVAAVEVAALDNLAALARQSESRPEALRADTDSFRPVALAVTLELSASRELLAWQECPELVAVVAVVETAATPARVARAELEAAEAVVAVLLSTQWETVAPAVSAVPVWR